MSLRREIRPYTDRNGLVTPGLYDGQHDRGSDNGVCFTSEYYILLADNQQIQPGDKEEYTRLINSCSVRPGLIARAPGVNQGGPPPDDLYAVAAASRVLDLPEIAKAVCDYGDANRWIFNADRPGNPHWYEEGKDFEAWLGRQPALVCALRAAAGQKLNFALVIITAALIATSCVSDKKDHTDPRRLSYLLVRAVQGKHWLLDLACKVWWNRLKKDYGEEGMRAVALIYYQNEHPFRRYWKNVWE